MNKEMIMKTIETEIERMKLSCYAKTEIKCYITGMLKAFIMTETITSAEAFDIATECDF